MELLQVRDERELATTGADLVAGWLTEPAGASMLAALGETPIGLYAELARRRKSGLLDTGRLTVVQLDAYLGLGLGDPRSLGAWLTRAVVAPLGVPESRVIRLPGDAADPVAACRTYDAAVAAIGGIDVAVLGLGPNGHLGFNEPPSDAASPTRVVELAEASLASNARYWGDRSAVPTRALTAGMPVILAAERRLLVVAGAHKRSILRRVLDGPAGPDVPATYLAGTNGVTVLADRAALGRP